MTEEILALVEEKPYTVLELAAALAVNQWTLRDHIATLEAHGHLFIERQKGSASRIRLRLADEPTSGPPPARPDKRRHIRAHVTADVAQAIVKASEPAAGELVGRAESRRAPGGSEPSIGIDVGQQDCPQREEPDSRVERKGLNRSFDREPESV